MSPQKEIAVRKYIIERARWIVDKFCEVPVELHDCNLSATTVHHMKGQHYKIMNDKRWWLPTCINGHRWIEDHKNDARRLGLILYGPKSKIGAP